MNIGRAVALALIASTVFAGPALAADLAVEVPAVDDGVPKGDWDGFYAGLGVMGTSFDNGVVEESTGYLKGIVGANFTIDSVLLGVEGWLGYYSVDTGVEGWVGGIEGRAGVLVTDDVALYGSVGGVFYDAGARYGTIGAGIEFAVTEDISLDLDYDYWGWSNNDYKGHSLGVSANWHF